MFLLCARYLLLHWQLRPPLTLDEISVSLWNWEMLHLFVQDLTGDVLIQVEERSRVEGREEDHSLSFSNRIKWLPNKCNMSGLMCTYSLHTAASKLTLVRLLRWLTAVFPRLISVRYNCLPDINIKSFVQN